MIEKEGIVLVFTKLLLYLFVLTDSVFRLIKFFSAFNSKLSRCFKKDRPSSNCTPSNL